MSSRDTKFLLSVVVPANNEKDPLAYNIRQVLKNEEVLEIIIVLAATAAPETMKICRFF